MAERKAVNKYYPPDWDPRKGSVNKRVGQHPLRDRARKLSQGILVIRFELPYNIWCGGCGSHVGMGVRYNAEKSKVGNYYTTPIYKFRMKCHLCDNYFEIQTDPKNHDYVILCGARRKEQRWDPIANEQIVPEDKATHKKMTMDAMYKLEHGTDDVQKGQDKKKSLAELESSRFSMRDDYILNRMARDKFRAEKKQLKSEAEADQAILDRGALDIELLDETEEDRSMAGLLKYSVTSSFEEKQKEKRRSIEQRPLFEPDASLTSTSTPSSSSSSSSHSNSSDPKSDSNIDLKSRLGQVLKMSAKDPFKIDKSSNMVKTSREKLSHLGIRIKSSRIQKPDKYQGVKSHSVKSEIKTLKKAVRIERRNVSSSVHALDTAKSELGSQSSEGCEKKSFDIAVPGNTVCISKLSTVSDSKSSFHSQDATHENPDSEKVSSDTDTTKSISFEVTDLPSASLSPNCDNSSTSQLPSADLNLKVTPSIISSPSSGQNSSLMSLMQSYDDGDEDEESDKSDA